MESNYSISVNTKKYALLGIVLRIPGNEIKCIYNKFRERGLAYVAMFNMYTKLMHRRFFYVSDFLKTVSEKERTDMHRFYSWCIANNIFLSQSKGVLYSLSSNRFGGFEEHPSKAERNLLSETRVLEQNNVMFDIDLIESQIADLIVEFMDMVVPSVRDRLNVMNADAKSKCYFMAVCLVNMCLRHSKNLIGLTTDLKIIANVLNASEKDIYSMMKKCVMINIDADNKIFYDSGLRYAYNLNGVPEMNEIEEVKRNYHYRVLFMDKIIRKYL